MRKRALVRVVACCGFENFGEIDAFEVQDFPQAGGKLPDGGSRWKKNLPDSSSRSQTLSEDLVINKQLPFQCEVGAAPK